MTIVETAPAPTAPAPKPHGRRAALVWVTVGAFAVGAAAVGINSIRSDAAPPAVEPAVGVPAIPAANRAAEVQASCIEMRATQIPAEVIFDPANNAATGLALIKAGTYGGAIDSGLVSAFTVADGFADGFTRSHPSALTHAEVVVACTAGLTAR